MSCVSTTYKVIARFKVIFLPSNWDILVLKADADTDKEHEVCGIKPEMFMVTDYGLRFESFVGNACLDDVISALRKLGELLGVEPKIRVKCL